MPYFIGCACNMDGSKYDFCDDNGNCTCKDNYDGEKCDQCKQGFNFTGFPNCLTGNFCSFNVFVHSYHACAK